MDKQQMQKIAGIKSEIVVKATNPVPKTITLTFDTEWLLEHLNRGAERFGMKLKPIEDINFKLLQKEFYEDLEVLISQDYFEDSIDGGAFENFLEDNEEED